MTKQPTWKMIANLGDVNPVDYGGFFVKVDTTGVYAPEAELIEVPMDELWSADGWSADSRWTVYRIILEPHTYLDGVLSENPRHPYYEVWYGEDLQSVADSAGSTVSDLIDALTNDDPIEKARAYQDLIWYFGPEEFDSYPLSLTYQEVTERTDRYLKELKANCNEEQS